MKRKLLIAALALGTVGGFASGFASLACRAHHKRARWEDKVTHICAEALREAQAKE